MTGFSDETQQEFENTCGEVARVFSQLGTEDEDFEVSTTSGIRCSIDVYIKNYEAVLPRDVMRIAPSITQLLTRCKNYWVARIWVYRSDLPLGSDDMCIWLEIDRYDVQPFTGKKSIELFDDIEALHRHFWSEK
jgi:hypothetical protein